jgi:branched-subunit amino acid transport protein
VTALVVFALAGAGVYLARASFIVLVGERPLPAWAERLLRNVGPAVLAALITSLLLNDGITSFATDPAQVVAVLVAVGIAVRTKSFVWTFIAGMAVYWLIGLL